MQSSRKTLNADIENFGVKPKKSYGQNFLVSDKALDRIVWVSKLNEGDKVLEVGPGTGLLTGKLLAAGADVVAVEKDRELFDLLKIKFAEELKRGQLVLMNEDFLDLDFPVFLEQEGFSAHNFKVVANLPYQITSPFFERVLERGFLPERLVLTLQKEVVDKIVSAGKKGNSLGVLIGLCSSELTIEKVFPPSFFHPQPKVSSALLLVTGLQYPEGVEIKKMRRLIKVGFSERRKKLINNLKRGLPEFSQLIESVWVSLGLDLGLRAEHLKREDWLNLYRKIF